MSSTIAAGIGSAMSSGSSSKSQLQVLRVLRALLRHAKETSASCPVALAAAAQHQQRASQSGAGSLLDNPVASLMIELPPAGRSTSLNASSSSSSRSPFWSSYILSHYRANKTLSKKSEIKQARACATDLLSYFEAVKEQTALHEAFKGKDVDKPEQRRDVARFVGLEMPKEVNPLDKSLEGAKASISEKYQATLLARTQEQKQGGGGGGGSGEGGGKGERKLQGIDNLKAQLFGIESLATNVNLQKGKKPVAAAAEGTAEALR